VQISHNLGDWGGMSILNKTSKERSDIRIKAYRRRRRISTNFLKKAPTFIKTFFSGIPARHRWNWLKSYRGENTRTEAIRAKCHDCKSYDKQQVYDCDMQICPLFHFRPKSRAK